MGDITNSTEKDQLREEDWCMWGYERNPQTHIHRSLLFEGSFFSAHIDSVFQTPS
jgi:hypothetical protein